jgi:1-phosphatidylinositol-3-phosphate 5-kinase
MDVESSSQNGHTESSAQSTFSREGRAGDDVASLTSFNPFAEEDESDQSSYALMSSFISRFKSHFTSQMASISQSTQPASGASVTPLGPTSPPIARRPPNSVTQSSHSASSSRSSSERRTPLTMTSSNVAPPLISLTPVVSDAPSFNVEQDSRPPSRTAMLTPSGSEAWEGGTYGTSIPGFPIQDDARSIRTMTSVRRSDSVSKVIRRIRGEGLIA